MTKSDLLKAVASKYNRSFSTVKRWASTGLDLSDDGAVERYVQKLDLRAVGASAAVAIKRLHTAKRKVAAAVPTQDVKKVLAELETVDPNSEGAAAALKRLQEFERNSSIRLNAAIAEGEPVLVSSATKDHVAIAGALIKFENLVSQEARASGELISKAEMENAVRSIAKWFRLSFQAWLSSESPNLVAINDHRFFTVEARKGFAFAVEEGFRNSLKSRGCQIPEWIAAIFHKEYHYGEDDQD